MQTPYFFIHEDELNNNVLGFNNALKKHWPNSVLSYSVKTNSLPWVLKYMKEHNVYAEVVSDEEYQLALHCGFLASEIVYNGPIKSNGQLIESLKNNSIVNLDSKNDLLVINENKIDNCERIGLRINVDTSFFNVEDIGYEEDGFRFGFSESDNGLEYAIHTIRKVYGDDARFGLHLHCNSVTRSVNVYKAIASYAVYIIKKYHLDPSFIDVGGGFFGGVEGKPTPENYISEIKDVLCNVVDINNTSLIIEPGSAMIGSVVDLHTSVIDVKNVKDCKIVTTDGSRIHIDPLWAKSRYMYSIESDSNESESKKQIICGYTCMDHDRIMILKNEKKINIGDKIIYHRVGAYSMTFGGMFIRYYPDVYVKISNSVLKVRSRIDVEEYYRIHTESH